MTRASPFSPAAVLGLVGLGTALFVALLWMIGAGLVHGSLNDGGAHGAGKGLTGYAALARLLERQGWQVGLARGEAQLAQPGLLVLTPPQEADGKALARIVQQRRRIGPTLIITPKWRAVPLGGGGPQAPGAKAGWISLAGAAPPEWPGFLDDLSVSLAPAEGAREWFAQGASGTLPDGRAVLSGHGATLVPLVALRPEGRVLAGYVAGDGHWPALDSLALAGDGANGAADLLPHEGGAWPIVILFEPDLANNYGLASRETAREALRLVEASAASAPRRVTFDLTLNGFARSPNLLTLAFTPPFLAATLCLLIAALLAGWRAFLRFGPALAPAGPALAFGKRQLVANAAGLLRRSRRLHLLGPPYAALVRERLVRALGLPQRADPAAREAAIDRALAQRAPGSAPFSTVANALRQARHPAELLRAAQALRAIERILEK
ncbi:DUF4350 domain-containing protein [Novosphingobium bradum]|uniref:DUF4350 domain-containing protein n=1 Tax=Novosphingobium bradum TaxID=1737444 RepID=A0ABV7IQI3_9SPHN